MNKSDFSRLCLEGQTTLKKAGIESAAAEVEIILEHLLDVDRLNVYLHGTELIDNTVVKKFKDIIKERATRYPLQLILGEAYFYGRRFMVTPDVMVPTPETEVLCELAINYVKNEKIESPEVLDIGVGSGVVSVTVAAEIQNASIAAVDISKAALKVAEKNAEALGVSGQIDFHISDCFDKIEANNQFDLILSNPPYISDSEYEELPPEVLADPKISLVSGIRGMDMIEKIITKAPAYLKKDGRLMFEIGYNQADLVSSFTEKDTRYKSIAIFRDLNDIDRVVILSV